VATGGGRNRVNETDIGTRAGGGRNRVNETDIGTRGFRCRVRLVIMRVNPGRHRPL
jgi:hypothetical protein